MRAFVFLCLLAPIMAFEVEINHVGAANPVQVMQARIMEDQIKAILECVRDILKNGDAEVGLPPLDPLDIPERSLDLNKLGLPGVSGQVNLKNIKGSGLAGWDLKKLKISVTIIPIGAKIQAEVVWPTGVLSGSYDADVTAFGHTVKGAGDVNGKLEKLRFTLDAQATISPIQIKKATIGASLASSSLSLGELAVDGVDIAGPISEFVDELPAFIVNNQAALNKYLKEVIIPALNKILGGIGKEGKGIMMTYDIPVIGKCLKL